MIFGMCFVIGINLMTFKGTIMTSTKRYHILLVEDNDGDVRLLEEAFKQVSSTVYFTVKSDGEEAMEFLTRLEAEDTTLPDLVILDLNIPKVRGTEVLAYLKVSRLLKMMPVIIMTTSNSPEEIQQCYMSGANCYICKPFDVGQLFDIVQSIDAFWLQHVILPQKV
jgi:two-component system, chemotaxis family, response regulator Rcp1